MIMEKILIYKQCFESTRMFYGHNVMFPASLKCIEFRIISSVIETMKAPWPFRLHTGTFCRITIFFIKQIFSNKKNSLKQHRHMVKLIEK